MAYEMKTGPWVIADQDQELVDQMDQSWAEICALADMYTIPFRWYTELPHRPEPRSKAQLATDHLADHAMGNTWPGCCDPPAKKPVDAMRWVKDYDAEHGRFKCRVDPVFDFRKTRDLLR